MENVKLANVTQVWPRMATGADDERNANVLVQPEQDPLDLRRIGNIIWRRKIVVIGCVSVIMMLAYFAIANITPTYVAKTSVVIETRRENVVDIEDVLQDSSLDYFTINTKADIIRSRSIAAKVVDELKLDAHPLYNAALRPKKEGLLERLGVRKFVSDTKAYLHGLVPEWVMAELGGAKEIKKDPVPLSSDERRAQERENAINVFLGQLSVKPKPKTYIIDISYTSEDPAMAALAANTVAHTYINESVRAKIEATERANEWLNGQVSGLRGALDDSERKLATYRRKIGRIDLNSEATLLGEQLVQLNQQLIVARAERAEAETRNAQVQRLLKSPNGIESVEVVLNSPFIQSLRQQETQVLRKIAELKGQLRERHPRMILARNELADLQAKIKQEATKIVMNLGNELETLQARENNVAAEMERLKATIESQTDAEVTLLELVSEADANKRLYETILSRFKETDVQVQGFHQADARIISVATTPRGPSYPRRGNIMGIVFVASAMLGVMLVMLIEYLDAGFRNLSQVEGLSGLPAIGMVPKVKGFGLRRKPLHQIILEKPNSVVAEAIQSIRTALLLSNVDQPPKTILVTSSIPREGKTATALALACSAAKSGQKAIIVDCDLRNPFVHIALGVKHETGIVDYLSGSADIDDIIGVDSESGVHFIVSGQRAANAPDLMGSQRMRRLIETLRRDYDIVVIDTPPDLVFSDVLILQRLVDKTLFLVRWGKTPRETALTGLKQALEAGADFAGVALAQVDLSEQSRYYSKYGYYYYGGRSGYRTE